MITILSAKYGNPDNQSALVNTVEAGWKAISAADTPELWDILMTWAAEPGNVIGPPDPPPSQDEIDEEAVNALGPVILNLAYHLNKRVRELEGLPVETKAQVKGFLKSWLVP